MFTAGTGDDAVTIFSANGNGYNQTRTSDEFTLTKTTSIYFQGGSDNQWVDWLYIYKTGDYTESKTISAAGYATYFSANALNFAGTGLTAYVAKVNGNDVSFEAVEQVPAETGVLLKGAAGDYQIPAIVSATAVESALVGVLEDTKVDAGIFVLLDGDQGVGFYKTTNEFTIGAGTAYLPAQTTTARTFIGFDSDELTGISEVSAEQLNGVAYDLQGRRVVNAQKGLYIVNGKKVIK